MEMWTIVPLAGPDFDLSLEETKAELLLEGMPLLRRSLESRPWWRREVQSDHLVFILQNTASSCRFAKNSLEKWYPKAKKVILNSFTLGAAFSALAGIAVVDPEAILCIDLADILYEGNIDPVLYFKSNPNLGGLALTFLSDNPSYSYLKTDINGNIIETAEKKVISKHASAGIYFFRNTSLYLRALSHSIENSKKLTFNNLFYICPLLNGIIDAGWSVEKNEVFQIRDIKQKI
ncbi:glycosyltransferase family protein [Zymomonas mobilis]|uniref:Dolichyl-phosphate mannose synthase n=1 Tax=Zymomonas mobilis subsp. pomaceae (strain ATCC 29192 / DSM 22645 / JCM 10191 / CCUG 17912 / NBRC 13757 / NCIMB 11200 / NRRL B-4491 / Barker I) TaxID=579138 RepID=F8ETE2_ZYMMT|nr:dolichyl-phosphate mannose synthase [Zymomonas mobilis]AEI37967.1 dolichyl-phosphate mannose synthase [Zymomonas mobilis subsp. pomaceae ATCC 29192]MDX5949335.1 hypothetical protein [Zymomonas mobilis subsp. pomaceae]GEB89934.1 hypothetical protein ZMO02_15710 [Zymomonas mobilis subsp. pomaceae]